MGLILWLVGADKLWSGRSVRPDGRLSGAKGEIQEDAGNADDEKNKGEGGASVGNGHGLVS